MADPGATLDGTPSFGFFLGGIVSFQIGISGEPKIEEEMTGDASILPSVLGTSDFNEIS